MTIDEFNKKLQAQKKAIEENIPLGIAAADTHAMMVERIFTDGLNSSGSKIGTYAIAPPMYIETKFGAPIKKTPKGKYGEEKFKNGKPHKTTYFESYKAFRQAESKESSFVNLNLFGNLKIDFETGIRRVSNKIWESFVKRSDSGDKIDGTESKYGKVFFLTKNERENFKKVLQVEIERILK